jgi:hypothetical protein
MKHGITYDLGNSRDFRFLDQESRRLISHGNLETLLYVILPHQDIIYTHRIDAIH